MNQVEIVEEYLGTCVEYNEVNETVTIVITKDNVLVNHVVYKISAA